MGIRRRRRYVLGMLVAVSAMTAGVSATDVSAGVKPASSFTATGVKPSSSVNGAKSTSGKLAQSDKKLLGRKDSARVNVVVKLDYDATASYKGGVKGFAATSPSVTGVKLTGKTAKEVAYEKYTGSVDAAFRAALAKNIPSAKAGISLQRVYGGVAVNLPANQAAALLALPGVAAVQADALNHPDTIESPQFIGAPTVWSQTGGQALAGKGVIFADLDTGLWPEHPSFADNPALGTPPRPARVCNFGDNPLTTANDPFVCNHKLIGGRLFLNTYNTLNGGEVYPTSARDSNGHGTHTTSTAAGNIVQHATVFGIDRGTISGVAPGAWVLEYKVCGLNGCYSSDSAAAVEQAIVDGANVINFSISGGTAPYADPVELAFLDAYAAGVTVAASAGNSGPAAGTTEHLSPWVITVAASTQSRDFQSTLTLADGATTTSMIGTSFTAGVSTATPIVLARNIPGYSAFCGTPLPAGSVTGKLVACQRGGGIGRVQKGFDVLQGGAAGMILYNLPLADTESDNHFLPTVHLADGTAFLAFMAAHPNATGKFTQGTAANGQGDVMASFSSRGPAGSYLKPDITAPGVQVLAGNTPTPDELASGPAGQYFQAIAGTSMSSPHIAGSALLMKALHPDWTPGQIKSALMTTAKQSVVKEDLVTPADPFDDGAGRVDLTKSGDASLTFSDTAQNMFTLGQSGLTETEINIPSIDVTTMPGTVTVHRTAQNVTNKTINYSVSAKTSAGSSITVSPNMGIIKPGKSQTFTITIASSAPSGQYFGQINIDVNQGPALHLPVAFFNKQGAATLTQNCTPTSIALGGTTTCTVTAQNNADGVATVNLQSTVSNGLSITGATGATVNGAKTTASVGPVDLAAPQDAIPSLAVGATPVGGYLDLADFGVAPDAIGDEQILNYNVPGFVFGGKTYSSIGIDSNGYLILGGSNDSTDNQCCPPQTLPDPTRPNGVLAPYWSDLDGSAAPGIRVGVLTDGVNNWIVAQWDVHPFGVNQIRSFQIWLGANGVEDISYGYPDFMVGFNTPAGYGLTVGVENVTGTAGQTLGTPPADVGYVVSTVPGVAGGSLSYTLTLTGTKAATQTLTSTMSTNVVNGVTRTTTAIVVRK